MDPVIYPLIPQFLSNRRKDVMAIREAIQGGDYEHVRLLGHRMRGDGASYGLKEVSEIGAALEQDSCERNSLAIQKSLNDLEEFLDRVEVDEEQTSGPTF